MSDAQYFDAGVVGAGIDGLAHAYFLAKSGMKVAVFERNSRAEGASLRDSGNIFPISQPAGKLRLLAQRSRDIWSEVLKESGIWHEECGSLHLAYRQDEAQVLDEFVNSLASSGMQTELLTPEQAAQKSIAIQRKGLLAGLWSPAEMRFDPREAIPKLAEWLMHRYGVQFHFNCAANSYHCPVLVAGGRSWRVGQLFACCGNDCESLFPRLLEDAGVMRCKQQRMRTTPYPQSWKLGATLAGGLSLRQSKAFAPCLSMETLRSRFATDSPLFDRYGISATVAQNGLGELVIGDSSECNDESDPFDKVEIDRLILDYLITFLNVPNLRIASRWQSYRLKFKKEPCLITDAAPGATLIANFGEDRTTLAFGIAEESVREKAL